MGDTPRQLVGVYPMGRGGLLEIPYRHYFEVKHLKQKVHFDQTMNVLELGCGNGRWALSLAPIVKHYTGVDFSRSALDIAQEDAQMAGLKNVELREQSILDFQGDRPYDIVYFSGVTQYLQDEEINKVLKNLAPHFKRNTVFIDRSTVNYREREILSTAQYYSIFRTPRELNDIFSAFGFHIIYEKRSYRFLRGGRFVRSRYLLNILPPLAHFTRPVSYYVMLFFSFMADILSPKPFEGGDRSHDFLIFERNDIHE